MKGYWKIWHDIRGRYLVAVLLVAWQVWSMTITAPLRLLEVTYPMDARGYPAVCVPAGMYDESPSVVESGLVDLAGRGMREADEALDNYRMQREQCGPGSIPTPGYRENVESWMSSYGYIVWQQMMPLTMLFIGILLAVGSPLSRDHADARTLTFSLPWSRSRWLRAKLQMTVVLCWILVLGAFLVARANTGFELAQRLHGYHAIPHLTMADAAPSALAAVLGLCIGLLATMVTPSSLIAALFGSLVAAAITMADLRRLFPTRSFIGSRPESIPLLDISHFHGSLVAVILCVGCLLLTWTRLDQADL